MVTRAKDGIFKPNPILTLYTTLTDFHNESKTLAIALKSLEWIRVMDDEYHALQNQKTWSLVPLPSTRRSIGCKWVYKLKTQSDGSIGRYRARLAEKGFHQEAGLEFGETFNPVAKFPTIRYSDSNWTGFTDDRKSTTDFCVFLGPNLLSWSAKKQPTIARSSTEAEYRALDNTVIELTWIQMLLNFFGYITLLNAPTLCDNKSVMVLATNPVFYAFTKHIEIDYHFICEKVQSKAIQLGYVSSSDQVADIFTKPLPVSQFQVLQTKLMVWPTTSLRGDIKPLLQETNIYTIIVPPQQKDNT